LRKIAQHGTILFCSPGNSRESWKKAKGGKIEWEGISLAAKTGSGLSQEGEEIRESFPTTPKHVKKKNRPRPEGRFSCRASA